MNADLTKKFNFVLNPSVEIIQWLNLFYLGTIILCHQIMVPNSFANFGAPFDANVTLAPSSGPAMTISESGEEIIYHLSYHKRFGDPNDLSDRQVYYLRSTLGGISGSWSDPLSLSSSISNSDDVNNTPIDVSIAALGAVVIVAWQQQGKIFAALSTDGGQNFGVAYEVSSGSANFRRLPDIKIDANNRFHLIWTEGTNSAITIKYSTSLTGISASWTSAVDALGAVNSNTLRAKIVIDNTNDRVVVAGQRISGTDRIQTRSRPRDPSAGNWGSTSDIGLSSSRDAYLNMAIDSTDNRVYLIYTDNVSDNPNQIGSNPILIRSSTDQGDTWTDALEIGTGYMPDITVNSENLHAVWYDPDSTSTPSTTGNIRFRQGQVPGTSIDLWDETEIRNVSLAQQIHFNTSWSFIDFFLGLPGVVSEPGKTTVFWVDDGTGRATLSQEIDLCEEDITGFNVKVNTSPFTNATFSVEITVLGEGGQPLIDENCGIGPITVNSVNSNFIPTTGSINVTSSPFTFHGYMETSTDSATLTVTMDNDTTITGTSDAFQVKDTETTDSEIEFIKSQQDETTSLVKTVLVDDLTAHIYTNALAIISFVHKGVLADSPDPSLLIEAEEILSTFLTVDRHTDSGNSFRGFFDSYNASTLAPAISNATSGNNAWLLMAINYYTIYANDSQFLDMAIELGKFIQGRQIIIDDPLTIFDDRGGVFSRDDPQTFVSEHQAEAYSALLFLAQIDGVEGTDALSFATAAENIRNFVMTVLFNNVSKRFNVAAGRNENTSTDAQTALFLALPGPTVNLIDISGALEYVFDNIHKEQNYLNQGRAIVGATFREDDPDERCHGNNQPDIATCPSISNDPDLPIDTTQRVWIEASAQLALAQQVLINAIEDSTQIEIETDRRNNLLDNIEKVRDPSGGYPIHLGDQQDCIECDGDIDEGEAELVGSDEISAVPAAWSYFNKVSPVLNPYVPAPTLLITQDKVFVPADDTSIVTLRITLLQAGQVGGQEIELLFEEGDGLLKGNPPSQVPINCVTEADGTVDVEYQAGNSSAISEIVIKLK